MKKLSNRIFALIFALIILAWMIYQFTSGAPGKGGPAPWIGALVMYSTFMVGYPIVVLGLLQEIRRPSIDFRLHRSVPWLALGAFLLVIFFLVNELHWSWREEFSDFFLGGFCMETSSFALLFGLLFMTRSMPQRSHSYKIMLIGVVLFELFVMAVYLLMAFGVYSPSGVPGYETFWTAITTQWFWYDFLSEAAILGGALWLLKKGKS